MTPCSPVLKGAPYSRGPCEEVGARESFYWPDVGPPEHFVWKELDLMDVSVETGTQLCRRPVAELLMFVRQLWASLLGHHFEKCIKVYWDSIGDTYFAVAWSWLEGLYKCFDNA
ncbi:hypothetical protein MRX96_053039 [Rhipicephalus microplus]